MKRKLGEHIDPRLREQLLGVKPNHAKPSHAKPSHAKPSHAKPSHAKPVATPPSKSAAKAGPTFHDVMEQEGTRRHAADERRRVPPPTPSPESVRFREAPRFAVEQSEGWVEGYREDAPVSVRGRLRGGPSATLDLHGLTTATARRQVLSFIALARAEERELVLVVVGKGRHSPRGAGVLREELAGWLTSLPVASHVLAVRTAPPELGGNGCVLVLLSRARLASPRRP